MAEDTTTTPDNKYENNARENNLEVKIDLFILYHYARYLATS